MKYQSVTITKGQWKQYLRYLESQYQAEMKPLIEDHTKHRSRPFWRRLFGSDLDALLAVERHGYKMLPRRVEPTVSGYFEWVDENDQA